MSDQPHHPPRIIFAEAHLRPLRPADASAFFAYLSDPAVTELTSYPPVTMPLVESMIQKSQTRWAGGELAKWAIALRRDDQLIGTCGFNDFSAAHRWAELAYDLAQAFWGKGLMRQAAAAAIDWAFADGQIDRVHAYVRTDNMRSAILLERLGFVREGCLRSFRVCRGRACDLYVYGLLRAEWAAKQK